MRRRLITVLVVLLVSWGGLAVTLAFGVTPRLGLDLQGGTSVILTAPEGTDPEVVEVAVEIMRSRIEDFGIQEPEISVTSDRTVLVQLPGVTNPERALDAIGQTGELSFRSCGRGFRRRGEPVRPDHHDDHHGGSIGADHLPTRTPTTAPGTTTTTAQDVTSTTRGKPRRPGRTPGDNHHRADDDNQRRPTTTIATTPTTIPEGVDPDTGLTIDDDPPQMRGSLRSSPRSATWRSTTWGRRACSALT